ncbi:MAG TPA: DegT/DnrJ/EryC1/StrS family aminotransferase [Candidatus Omnitrophota bacterium]|nr:DegT/DnrJ/EryC1/StrS family aminotransferase [Candidatus Omnitrophota bacterium]
MLRFHLAEDTIDQKDIDRLIEWLKGTPRLTKDKLNVLFENQWSRWIGRKFSAFCNSGSSANLLMYYALLLSGKLKNKKVIVPATGWVTTIAPAIQFGFEPILCESDPDTFGLNLDHLEKLLKKHEPSAVTMVQVLGIPHKMNAVMALKKKYRFILLEDACASIGSTFFGRKIGTFGDMSSFSFYFGHQMSTIEGGMVSTDNPLFRDLLLMLRSHGWSKDLDPVSHQKLVKKYRVNDDHKPFVFYEPGLNLRSTDLNAFLGLRQLEKLEWMISRRHANHLRYQKHLGERFRIQQCKDPDATLSSISFCMLAKNSVERHSLAAALTKNGIETRLFTAGNLGRHPFWFNRYGKPDFPVADQLYQCGIFLPNNPALDAQGVDFISKIVLEASCRKKSS